MTGTTMKSGTKRPALRAGSAARRVSLLIVDESAAVAHVERAVANAYGFAARVTTSGSEAVQLLEDDQYDVLIVGSPVYVDDETLILDLLMSDLQRYARRTLVVTTHIQDAAVAERAARANVFAVIAKPFDISVLAETVSHCARNGGAPGPTRWIDIREPGAAQNDPTAETLRSASDEGNASV